MRGMGRYMGRWVGMRVWMVVIYMEGSHFFFGGCVCASACVYVYDLVITA